ncbi:carboxypeptidase-like regulatory domain-containing protein [Antarctobacter sp.]|uniref:carboxypeptidase-like regulatory domain-containing protein n=1 Tax=Antarctobacter sp. TaxID=1872577 RepID=UPI002B26F418|nr:carboxypeptidase-like regulatory domain-containing protein [Antarctobacter sp.]
MRNLNIRHGSARLFLAILCYLTLAHSLSAQSADAINDLLRGATREAVTAPPAAAPMAEAAGFGDPRVGKTADGNTTVTYFGQAAGDGRQARIELVFAGSDVSGTIWIQSVCEDNIRLGGADLTFAATLSGGAWESKEAEISGTWQGTEHFCGTEVANEGTLQFFLKDDGYFDPVLHLRLTGKRGRYGWNFGQSGRVIVEGPGNVIGLDGDVVSPGAKDPAGTDKKDDKKGPPVDDEIDPDTVTGFQMLPGLMWLKLGESMHVPSIRAVLEDEARLVWVPDTALNWTLGTGLERKDGKFFVAASAKDKTEIPYEVRIRLGHHDTTLKGRVKVMKDVPLGSISGRIYFEYSPLLKPVPILRPLSAEVELHFGTRVGGPGRAVKVGADGRFAFDKLRADYYRVVVRSLVPPAFPGGYELDRGSAPWLSQTIAIGEQPVLYSTPETIWHHKTVAVFAKVILPPDTDGAIYGRVHHNDKGIEGVTVWAHQVGSTGVKRKVSSGKDGFYLLKIDDLAGGTYVITAEKYVRAGWAGPQDLLDVAKNRLENPILVSSPLSDPRGVEINIEVDTRYDIFGGSKTPTEPIKLPGEE